VLHEDINDIENGETSCGLDPVFDEFCEPDPAFDDSCFEPTRLGFQVASSAEEAMTLFVQSRGFPTIGSFIDWGSEGGHLCISLDAWIADSCEYDEAESIARLEAEFEAFNAQHPAIGPHFQPQDIPKWLTTITLAG
jgi:hypothetical protein